MWRELVHRQAAESANQGVQGAGIPLKTIADLIDQGPGPEAQAIEKESHAQTLRLLRMLSQRDREVLTRFYLEEQSPEEICRALRLTKTQFRLIKSRAKARYTEICRQRDDRIRLQEPEDSPSAPPPQHAKSGTLGGQILTHAAETFGSAEKAEHWLNRPSHVFQGKTPLEMLAIDPKSVEIELSRIDHGVYI